MSTVAQVPTTRKAPIAFYGWLRDEYGVFLQADGEVAFRDDATYTWEDVDLETLTTWAVLCGRCDIADAQKLADGDRVRRCSKTLVAA